MSDHNITLERDCPLCEEGTVEFHFALQPIERDVGIMQGYAMFDWADSCSMCYEVPTLTDDEIEALEQEAIEEAVERERGPSI